MHPIKVGDYETVHQLIETAISKLECCRVATGKPLVGCALCGSVVQEPRAKCVFLTRLRRLEQHKATTAQRFHPFL